MEYEITPERQAEWDDAMYALNLYYRQVEENNKSILESISKNALRNFRKMTADVEAVGMIEVVDAPKGALQDGEKFGLFKKVFVEQWSVSMDGDSYEGNIYAYYGIENKWLKIPYSC